MPREQATLTEQQLCACVVKAMAKLGYVRNKEADSRIEIGDFLTDLQRAGVTGFNGYAYPEQRLSVVLGKMKPKVECRKGKALAVRDKMFVLVEKKKGKDAASSPKKAPKRKNAASSTPPSKAPKLGAVAPNKAALPLGVGKEVEPKGKIAKGEDAASPKKAPKRKNVASSIPPSKAPKLGAVAPNKAALPPGVGKEVEPKGKTAKGAAQQKQVMFEKDSKAPKDSKKDSKAPKDSAQSGTLEKQLYRGTDTAPIVNADQLGKQFCYDAPEYEEGDPVKPALGAARPRFTSTPRVDRYSASFSSGGFAKVWVAAVSKHVFCIKEVRSYEHMLCKDLMEAEILAQLAQHGSRFVPEFYGVELLDKSKAYRDVTKVSKPLPYLYFRLHQELLLGPTWYDHIRSGKLNNASNEVLVTDLLAGIEWLHQLDVNHNDIKLQNLVLQIGQDGLARSVIVDFGSATRGAKDSRLHLTPSVLGINAMKPKLRDWYAAGCCLYALYASEPNSHPVFTDAEVIEHSNLLTCGHNSTKLHLCTLIHGLATIRLDKLRGTLSKLGQPRDLVLSLLRGELPKTKLWPKEPAPRIRDQLGQDVRASSTYAKLVDAVAALPPA